MKTTLKREWPNIIVTALPFIYLAYIWNSLPAIVPLHWNMAGEIDRYGNRSELIIIPFILPFLTYLIFLIVPYIDPKRQIEKMGKKYHQLKTIFVFLTSLLAIYILYATSVSKLGSTKLLFFGIGMLITVLGNYMQSIKPNYFIGIRTPWTLENNEVWKYTHRLAGKLWVIGGLFISVFTLILSQGLFTWLFIFIMIVITLIPLIYSYIKFKEIENT